MAMNKFSCFGRVAFFAMIAAGLAAVTSSFAQDCEADVTDEDIARGYRLAWQNGAGGMIAMPLGSITNELLRLRGGYDWAFRVEPSNWQFFCRDELIDGVTVLASGEVRINAKTPYFPAAIDKKVSLLPECKWNLLPNGEASVFSHAVTESGSLLLDWHNALAGRDFSSLTNLQFELCRDGSFAWRTDNGETRYFPVLPFDYDNDGLENSIDIEPLIACEDAHAANAEWYERVCPDVFSKDDTSSEPVELPNGEMVYFRSGVNEHAYYFVDAEVSAGPAPIAFVADRYSLLGSPIVIARAGEVCHVPLLVGIEYSVTSTVPFSVTAPVSLDIDIKQDDALHARVKRPLTISFEEQSNSDGVRVFKPSVSPPDLGGEFIWEKPSLQKLAKSSGDDYLYNRCGCLSVVGDSIYANCSDECNCSKGCEIRGYYFFESALFAVTGGVCSCNSYDPESEDPSLSIRFSGSAIIFEDEYRDRPGVVNPRRSTRVELSLSARGGSNGGTLYLAPSNLEKLVDITGGTIDFPSMKELAPGETFSKTFICEAKKASAGEGDVKLNGFIIEKTTGMRFDSGDALTVVEVKFNVKRSQEANPNRHVWGVGEKFYCEWTPKAEVEVIGVNGCKQTDEFQMRKDFQCPFNAASGIIQITCCGIEYTPHTQVLEPESIEARNAEQLDFPVPPGMPGGAGFEMDLYIKPEYVSFQELEIIEEPTYDSEITGYFRNPELSWAWHHTVENHAGVWYKVRPDNLWFRDGATMGDELFLPCTKGKLVWKIPIFWRQQGDYEAETYKKFTDETQTFTMTANGTLRVEKYGLWAERNLDGSKNHSEGMR